MSQVYFPFRPPALARLKDTGLANVRTAAIEQAEIAPERRG
jgi:hypothetical protein